MAALVLFTQLATATTAFAPFLVVLLAAAAGLGRIKDGGVARLARGRNVAFAVAFIFVLVPAVSTLAVGSKASCRGASGTESGSTFLKVVMVVMVTVLISLAALLVAGLFVAVPLLPIVVIVPTASLDVGVRLAVERVVPMMTLRAVVPIRRLMAGVLAWVFAMAAGSFVASGVILKANAQAVVAAVEAAASSLVAVSVLVVTAIVDDGRRLIMAAVIDDGRSFLVESHGCLGRSRFASIVTVFTGTTSRAGLTSRVSRDTVVRSDVAILVDLGKASRGRGWATAALRGRMPQVAVVQARDAVRPVANGEAVAPAANSGTRSRVAVHLLPWGGIFIPWLHIVLVLRLAGGWRPAAVIRRPITAAKIAIAAVSCPVRVEIPRHVGAAQARVSMVAP